jgi:2-octaprenylphenol hydroxylase
LHSQHASHYVKSKIALIGDAAHTIHPLAGQGVNLGFADAACLGEVLDDALKQQRPLSSMVALRRYERWRRGENLLMQSTMSGFKVLFSNENSVVSLIRNLGLNITDNIGPIKNQIMRHAMGLSGDLPKIAQQPFL